MGRIDRIMSKEDMYVIEGEFGVKYAYSDETEDYLGDGRMAKSAHWYIIVKDTGDVVVNFPRHGADYFFKAVPIPAPRSFDDLDALLGKSVYTRDEAARITEVFEDALDKAGVTLPSPEDDEREPDNTARLYGSVYYGILDAVEAILIDCLREARPAATVVTNVFSGA